MSLIATATNAFVLALTGAPGVPAVSRIRMRPVAQGAASAVVVRPLQSEVLEASMAPGYPVSWNSTLAVECYARATPGTTPDMAVDAIVSSVYAALMSDTTLAGAVIHIAPQSLTYDFDADADNTVCATFVFTARQTSAAGSF